MSESEMNILPVLFPLNILAKVLIIFQVFGKGILYNRLTANNFVLVFFLFVFLIVG